MRPLAFVDLETTGATATHDADPPPTTAVGQVGRRSRRARPRRRGGRLAVVRPG